VPKVQNNYPTGPDEYRVEQHPVEGYPLVKKWFVVGGDQPSLGGQFWSWKGYSQKSGAQRALKRLYEREPGYAGCPMCGRTVAELRNSPGCPIESINCLSDRRFPSKQTTKRARVETRNDLNTVYAVVDDPNNMGIDKSNHPVIGFAVRTHRLFVRADGTQEPVTSETVRKMIEGLGYVPSVPAGPVDGGEGS
jgi:hypothetical protein